MTPPAPASSDPIGSAFAEFSGAGVTRAPASATELGTVGPYTLLDTLGEGGFGTVYLAEQHEPLRRTVALKVLRSGLGSVAATKRFEAERQMLAMLDHPSIAAIHDAGMTDAGQPYFVMEHVDGLSITRYCAEHRLGQRERLTLFRDVCLAVQFAHERGVIHRDLKPSNVLVCERNDAPVPKVIDFGIAKLTQEDDDAVSLMTVTGQVLGTPEYMSPEQAAGGAAHLDARSDVYSLGVILYELLTGSLPLLDGRSRDASIQEILRIVCDDEPVRPSTRVRRLSIEGGGHGPESRSVARGLRGDLDWVCLRALDKDPARRYPSPLALANDIERFLEGRTVQATPPSVVHRTNKFVRRHRGLVTATILLFLTMTAGIVGTSTALFRSKQNARAATIDRIRFDGARLAAEARAMATDYPTRAVLLALEAEDRFQEAAGLEGVAGAPDRHAAVNDALYQALPWLQEESVLLGHQRIAFAPMIDADPTGRRLASLADEPFVLLWGVASGVLEHRLEGLGEHAADLGFGTSSSRVAASSKDGRSIVWDVESGRPELTVDLAPTFASKVRLAEGGRLLIVGCDDGSILGIDVSSGATTHTYGRLAGSIVELELGHTGEHFAARAAFDCAIWNVRSGAMTADMRGDHRLGDGGQVVPVVSSAGQDGFALHLPLPHSAEPTFIIVDHAGEGSTNARAGRIRHASLDGETLYFVLGEESTKRAHGRTLGRIDVPSGEIESADVPTSANMGLLLAFGDGESLWAGPGQVYELMTRPTVGRRTFNGHRYGAEHAVQVPASSRFVTSSKDRSLRIWNRATPSRAIKTPLRRLSGTNVIASTDSGTFLLGWLDELETALVVLHLESGETSPIEIAVDEPLHQPMISADGRRVVLRTRSEASLVRHGIDGQLAVLDSPSWTPQLVDIGVDVRGASVRDDGAEALVVSGAGPPYRVTIVDLSSCARRDIETDLFGGSGLARWSSDHSHIAVRTEGTRTALVRARDGKVRYSFSGHGGDHLRYAFSPDGRYLLSAAVDRTAAVRETQSGQVVARYRGLSGEAKGAGFLGGGDLAWVQTRDRIDLFDPLTGAAVAHLFPRDGSFCTPTESFDGRWLLTVSDSGWFQRFPLDPVAYAREVAPRGFEPEELEMFGIGAESERLERVRALVRATPTGTRLLRGGRLLRDAGDLDGAIELLEEAVATGTLDHQPWFYLSELLCERAAMEPAGDDRRASVDAAIDAIEGGVACGVHRSRAAALAADEKYELLWSDPRFRALVDG